MLTLSLLATPILAGCGSEADDIQAPPSPPPPTPPSPGPPSPPPEPPPPPAGVGLREVTSGLEFPVDLTAPAGDPRLFVVERDGRIRIVKDGVLLADPFLDITDRVSTGGERGLLGLAFDPAYATTGRFFVHYTNRSGDTRLSVFRVSADPDRADAGSERVLLGADQPFANHNGGRIAFGPDGYLYMALGDGGSFGDPGGRGQRLDELLGSLLRLDVSSDAGAAVPADNPFVGRENARGEVWSYGLRNPWRFSFDRATGDLYIADVGEREREEIDVSPAAEGAGRGVNYGWKIMEGSTCFGGGDCRRDGLALPVYEYGHDNGCSVTGGYVYRGSAIPALQGLYFFSDFCGGWVRSFRYAGGAATEVTDWPALTPGGNVPSFGEDAAGELYILTAEGKVFQVVPQ